jgi:hypothetical protein
MDLVKHTPSHLTNRDIMLWYHTMDTWQQAIDVEAQKMSQDCPRRTAQQVIMGLSDRPTWAQLVDLETLETITIYLSMKSQGRLTLYHHVWFQHLSPNSRRSLLPLCLQWMWRFQHPLRLRRRPVRCKKRTTKWNEIKALPKEIMDSFRPVFLRGETVPSLNSLTRGIVVTEQHGYLAITPRQGMWHEVKIFLPYLRKMPGPPCGQSDPYPGKRIDCTWKRPRFDKAVAAAVRHGWTTRYR